MSTPEVAAAVAELQAANENEGRALVALSEARARTGTASARLADLLEVQPASELVVELRVVDATSSTVTVEWSVAGPEPAGWTIGRDGVDVLGTGGWSTRLAAATRRFVFSALRAGTQYTLALTPDDGQLVSLVVSTKPAGTGPPPAGSGAHGPRALSQGWADLLIDREDFTGPTIDTSRWSLYNSVGHGGKGLRRPGQWSIVDDPAAIDGRALRCVGTPEGTTGGMAMRLSQRFGRWAIRMRADGDEHYHQVGLTWSTAENWPAGGEIDFAEGNAARDKIEFFLHYSSKNQQTYGSMPEDRRGYSWYEVEWTPDYVRGWCDGVQFFEDRDRSHFNYNEFGAHHLCLQLDWFPDGAARTGAAEMFVDAVRVYAHPASVRMRAPQGLLGGSPLYSSPVVDRFAKL